MRKAFITGITGQDGSLLAELLLTKGYEVIGFGRRSSIITSGLARALADKVTFAYGDLADPMSIAAAIQRHRPDELYNLASQSNPGLSWSQSVETGEITGMGAHRLFEAVRQMKPDCRVYHASSSEMYGEVLASPQDESTPFNPLNPYAAAKVYAHQMARIYRRTFGLFVACGILFNHESDRRGMRYLTQKVAYGAACATLGIRDSVEVNEEGEPIVKDGKLRLGNLTAARDWGYAGDYVDAMWRMLQQPEADDFVIGTGQLRTVTDLCAVAYESVGLDWREYIVSDARFFRPSETGATMANPAKAHAKLGWRAVTPFETTIAGMVSSHVRTMQA